MENIKTVVVGDHQVGKTSLLIRQALSLTLTRYRTNTFRDETIATVFDGSSESIMIAGRPINLGLWDSAGQQEYDKVRPTSYPDTDIFLVCFSVDNRESFQNAKSKVNNSLSSG